ncbi:MULTISPECIES: hypothetical protein [unclassified Spirosoma]|mgnify:CR=1 FL=1|uniref:hypothetical protein n=1 Tax=unclassified Spirosoma TaxID=2621999 RepID=UPI000960439D|nr:MULTISPECIES: hypothetical protein [unclassified Spirosoma]MBN8826423.1 hypothetical protein [Spirosoma sp.]OJW75813.1 MAG: hypothetical protein BGO59_04840 [Spirosoma sp. 48-14]
MKSYLLNGIVLLLLVLGCRRTDDVAPNDLLYRKWRIAKIQYATGNPEEVVQPNPWALVEFRPNGTILYGEDGKYDPCCSPARFRWKGDILDLQNVADIPMPERTPNGLCAMVSCALFDPFWQIAKLNPSELVIQQDRALVTYAPYP